MGSSFESESPNLDINISSGIRQSTRFLFTSAAMVTTLVNLFQDSSLGNETPVSPEADVR